MGAISRHIPPLVTKNQVDGDANTHAHTHTHAYQLPGQKQFQKPGEKLSACMPAFGQCNERMHGL